jgi:hypothetical protein
MSEPQAAKWISDDDPVAIELRLAVHAGDVAAVERLLQADAALATARLIGRGSGAGTTLHLVTD